MWVIGNVRNLDTAHREYFEVPIYIFAEPLNYFVAGRYATLRKSREKMLYHRIR